VASEAPVDGSTGAGGCGQQTQHEDPRPFGGLQLAQDPLLGRSPRSTWCKPESLGVERGDPHRAATLDDDPAAVRGAGIDLELRDPRRADRSGARGPTPSALAVRRHDRGVAGSVSR